MHTLVVITTKVRNKFNMSSFTRCKDMMRAAKF